jgi:hypothetical protein
VLSQCGEITLTDARRTRAEVDELEEAAVAEVINESPGGVQPAGCRLDPYKTLFTGLHTLRST